MIIAVVYVVIFFVFILFSKFIKRSEKIDIFMFVGIAIALSVIAYNALPRYDLAQHFGFVNSIQASRKTYWGLIKNPLIGYGHNRFYFVFELFCVIVAKLGNFHLLPAFMVLVDYLIFGYITLDWTRRHSANKGSYLIIVLLCMMFMPYMYAVSGLRNAMAASMMGLAVYLYLEKEKWIVWSVIIMLAAVLIHPAVLIVIPFCFLAKWNLSWKMILVVVIIVASLHNIANIFSDSSNIFLRMLGSLYLRYSSDTQYWGSRRYLYGDLIFIVAYLVVSLIHWKERRREQSYIYNFLLLYVAYIFGNIGNYDLVCRPVYVLAPLAAPLTQSFLGEKWMLVENQSKILKTVVSVVLCLICLWVVQDYCTILISQYF